MSFNDWEYTRTDGTISYDEDSPLNVSIIWKTLVLHSIISETLFKIIKELNIGTQKMHYINT